MCDVREVLSSTTRWALSVVAALVIQIADSHAFGAEPIVFTGHREVVYDSAFLPDGKSVVTASFDKTLKLWDVATQKTLRTMEGHTGIVLTVAVSPDGTLIASGSGDRSIRLWDVPKREPLSIQDLNNNAVTALASTADGSLVATADASGHIRIWSLAPSETSGTTDSAAKPTLEIPIEGKITRLAWRHDRNQLAAGFESGSVRLINPTDGATVIEFEAHKGPVTGIQFSSNSQQVFTAGKDGFVRRWATKESDDFKAQLEHQADETAVNGLAISANGSQYATAGADGTIKLWNSSNSSPIRSFAGITGEALCVSLSPDSRQVAAGGEDNSIRTWDVNRATGILRIEVPTVPTSISYSPNSTRLVAGLDNHTLQCFDPTAPNPQPAEPPTREASQTLEGHSAIVSGLVWSADSESLRSASTDGTIRHWSVAGPRERATMTGHSSQVYAVAFSPDGRILASASSDKTVRLWDIASSKQLRTLTTEAGAVYGLSFSPDGKQLAITVADNSVKLLEVASGREVRAFTGPEHPVYSVSISPDGKSLAAAGMGIGKERPIFVWNSSSEAPQTILDGHADDIYRVEFSPSGSRLLSVGYSGTIRVWDVAVGKTLLEESIENVSYSARYSPDGVRLIVSSNDRAARLLDIPEAAR